MCHLYPCNMRLRVWSSTLGILCTGSSLAHVCTRAGLMSSGMMACMYTSTHLIRDWFVMYIKRGVYHAIPDEMDCTTRRPIWCTVHDKTMPACIFVFGELGGVDSIQNNPHKNVTFRHEN